MSHTTMLYVRTYHRLPRKIWCLLSEHMLHTKKWNVQSYVTHEYELYSVRTYVIYRNVLYPNICSHEKMNTRKYDVLCPKNVQCSNILVCYTQIWDIFWLNLCYTRKCNTSEPMLLTKIWCLVSALMSNMKMCNVHFQLYFFIMQISAYPRLFRILTSA